MNKLLTLFLILFTVSFTQNQEKYDEYVKEACNLYNAKEYQKSVENYNEAFDQLEEKDYANDIYISYAFAADEEQINSQQTFDWLIGNWRRTNDQEDKSTYETWQKKSDSEYSCFSYTLQNKDTIWQEKVQLIKSGEGWRYDVRGEGETKPSKFKLTTIEKTGFVCENQLNEFPKFIEYNRKEENLKAKIWSDEMEVFFEFEQVKE